MKIKKIVLLTVTSVIAMSLIACSNSKQATSKQTKKNEVTQSNKNKDKKFNENKDVQKEDKLNEDNNVQKENEESEENVDNDVQKENEITKENKENDSSKEKTIQNKIVENKTEEVSQEKIDKGTEILKRGYIGGGTYIVFKNKETIENKELYKYNVEYDDEKEGKRKVGSVFYIDVDNEKVYGLLKSGQLKEILLDY